MSKSTTFQDKPVAVGDLVRIHQRLIEGGKERVQVFEGLVLALKGRGDQKMLTVRKISSGIGVEKTIPLISPWLAKIEIKKPAAKTRRAKLYHLRPW